MNSEGQGAVMGNLAEASPTPDDPSPTTGASPTEGANLLPPKPKLHGDPMYQPIKEMLRRALVQAPEKEAFITGLHHRVQQYALGTDANVRSAEALLRSAAKHLADNIGLERIGPLFEQAKQEMKAVRGGLARSPSPYLETAPRPTNPIPATVSGTQPHPERVVQPSGVPQYSQPIATVMVGAAGAPVYPGQVQQITGVNPALIATGAVPQQQGTIPPRAAVLQPSQYQHYVMTQTPGFSQPLPLQGAASQHHTVVITPASGSQPQSQTHSHPQQPPGGASKPSASTKRPASDPAADAPKPKRANKGNARARGGRKGDDDDEDGEVLVVGGEVIHLQEETDAIMDRVQYQRVQLPGTTPDSGTTMPYRPEDSLQYLSSWRIANQALRLRREKAPSLPIDSFLDMSVLVALQRAFTEVASGVLKRSAEVARHRVATSKRPASEFAAVPAWDVRRELGRIRRRDEEIAEAKAAEEREKVLKAAASKRADEETKALAQRAKAEMAGQQQAAAANKALAATLGLGGKDAKWARWGGGNAAPADAAGTQSQAGGARAVVKGSTVDGESQGEGEKVAPADDEAAEGGPGPSNAVRDVGSGPVPGAGPVAGGGGTAEAPGGVDAMAVQLDDVAAALQLHPKYCRSPLLYRLLNGVL